MLRPACFLIALVAPFLCSAAQPAGKTRVLLDTDCFNEIDDQFFVTYSLLEPSFEIEGITAAQYRWERGSVDESYYEILRVIDLMGIAPRFPIVRGADGPMPDARTGLRSAATDLIRQAALRDRSGPLYILAVGALTNVASALVLHPEIRPLIRVIWLGGFPADGNMNEFNAHNDLSAVKTVFESGVDLTVVPTETSARLLTLPYAEAEGRLRDSNRIAKRLLSLLRDYSDRNKIIWDISTTACLLQLVRGAKFFEITTELAPRVDDKAGKYIHRQGPHKIKVCGAPNRQAVFADFFERLPKPKDTDPPSLLFAASTGDPTSIDLAFSEALDRSSALRPECYAVSGGATVASAALTSDRAVRLKVSPPLAAERKPQVRVSCVADRAGNKVLDEWSEAEVRIETSAAPGLSFAAYAAESGLRALPPPGGNALYRGVIGSVALPGPELPEAVARPKAGLLVVAEGVLNVPFDHRYEFDLVSRKFARVYLDSDLFLDQSQEGDRRSSRTRVIQAGPHRIRVEHYADRSSPSVSLYWNLPFHDKSLVGETFFFHREPAMVSGAKAANRIVYRDAGRFGGWPANHGIWSWGNEILVGFEAGYFRNNATGHAIDYSRPAEHVLARSLDGGETWKIERPEGLRPPSNQKVAGVPTGAGGKEPEDCPGGIDFTSPGFIFTARMTSIHVGPSRFYYSMDRGKTWNGPFRLPDFGQKGIAARSDYVVNGPHDMTAFLTAAKSNGLEGRVIAVRTQDGGKTWKFVSFVGPEPPEDDFAIMPSSVAFSEGRILTAIRHRHFIEAWRSADGGATWSFAGKPAPDTGGGNPPSMIRLKDGRLAIAYGYRAKPFGIRARLSSDEGNTWSEEMILRADGGSGDLGYPRSVQRPDGKIVTVYYFNDSADSERYIGATIWDPK